MTELRDEVAKGIRERWDRERRARSNYFWELRRRGENPSLQLLFYIPELTEFEERSLRLAVEADFARGSRPRRNRIIRPLDAVVFIAIILVLYFIGATI